MLVYLGLGSNLGSRIQHLQRSRVDLSKRGVWPLRMSPVYEGPYLGPGAPQPDYLNAVVEARTDWEPLELLWVLQEIEADHGRRPSTHGAPRPLDLDLLLYGNHTLHHHDLEVPHPRMGERRFVLQPLRDLGVLEHWPDGARRLEWLEHVQPLRRVGGADGGEESSGSAAF